MLWWYDERVRGFLAGALAALVAVLGLWFVDSGAQGGATTSTVASATTTPQQGSQMRVTDMLNAVARRGEFLPRVSDLETLDGVVSLLEDSDDDGYDDDGRVELDRGGAVICIQLPAGDAEVRGVTMSDGRCTD